MLLRGVWYKFYGVSRRLRHPPVLLREKLVQVLRDAGSLSPFPRHEAVCLPMGQGRLLEPPNPNRTVPAAGLGICIHVPVGVKMDRLREDVQHARAGSLFGAHIHALRGRNCGVLLYS